MMCNPFTVNFESSPEKIFSFMQSKADEFFVDLSGDSNNGAIDTHSKIGHFSATYLMTANAITIIVIDKPVLIPCKLIENKVRDALRAL